MGCSSTLKDPSTTATKATPSPPPIRARFLNGEEKALIGCTTVNDVKLFIASVLLRFIPEVRILDPSTGTLVKDNAALDHLPPIVDAVLLTLEQDKAFWMKAIRAHALLGDKAGLQRAMGAIDTSGEGDLSGTTCGGEVLLDELYLFSRNDDAYEENNRNNHNNQNNDTNNNSNSNNNNYNDDQEATNDPSVLEPSWAIKCIVTLIEGQVDVNCAYETNPNGYEERRGQTALHHAAAHGLLDICSALIERRADVDAVDYFGRTSLNHATEAGHEHVVALLLKSGARVDRVNYFRQSCLHVASGDGHEAIVSMLLDAQADVNAVDGLRQSSLHYAARFMRPSIVRQLLKAGAIVDLMDNGDQTALHHASIEGNSDVVVLLLEAKAEVDSRDKDGQTSLHVSSWYGHNDITTVLLLAGAEIKRMRGDY